VTQPNSIVRPLYRAVRNTLVCSALAFAVLSIPSPQAHAPSIASTGEGFAWNRDGLWRDLENRYAAQGSRGCSQDEHLFSDQLPAITAAIKNLEQGPVPPTAVAFDRLEGAFFAAGPAVARCPDAQAEYAQAYARLRDAVKRQSSRWDMTDGTSRERLYRVLYGGRAAVEEVMLQQPQVAQTLMEGATSDAPTPSSMVQGVEIHSGDLLLSRGGAPTSALIARGNDHPGNFSHVALVHVDEASGQVSVIESHIEQGVIVAKVDEYFADKKLRILVLRLRADLPSVVEDPFLPHRAAKHALRRVQTGHVPYDFEMDYQDSSKLFCSEVASSAYQEVGVTLWMGLSTLSRPGLRRWLYALGVRHFITQEPSDLEYDPQLAVVAEWRDPDSLWQDHVDNAVIDAMLEGADAGDDLSYPWYQLAAARLLKAYSAMRILLGGRGPIPEGMAADTALRVRAFSARHAGIAEKVYGDAVKFERERGYRPPYWVLVQLAREQLN
jgi:hypothetical protein